MQSLGARTESFELMASQDQAPASEVRISLMFKMPKPSTEVAVTRGGPGMWCQLRRQLISGVGLPTARQVMLIDSPSAATRVSGGGCTTVGGAKEMDIVPVILSCQATKMSIITHHSQIRLTCQHNRIASHTDRNVEYIVHLIGIRTHRTDKGCPLPTVLK